MFRSINTGLRVGAAHVLQTFVIHEVFLPAATFGAVRSTGAKVLDVGGGGTEYSEMSRRNKSIGPSAPTFWWWRYIVSRRNITGPSAPSFFHM